MATVQDLQSASLPIKCEERGSIIHKFKAALQRIRDEDHVCVEVKTDQVLVTGFSKGVRHAQAKLADMLAEETLVVDLPVISGCADLSWRFVKPTLRHLRQQPGLKEVVLPSSGPGRVELQGLADSVQNAAEAIRTRLLDLDGRAMPLDRTKKALVIGSKGANIKRWEADDIVVIIGDDGKDDDHVYIGGVTAAVGRVAEEITQMLTTCRSKQSGKGRRREGEGQPGKGSSLGKGGGKQLCRFFEQGRCGRGEDCRYLHLEAGESESACGQAEDWSLSAGDARGSAWTGRVRVGPSANGLANGHGFRDGNRRYPW